jgi:hypothetical protein
VKVYSKRISGGREVYPVYKPAQNGYGFCLTAPQTPSGLARDTERSHRLVLLLWPIVALVIAVLVIRRAYQPKNSPNSTPSFRLSNLSGVRYYYPV